MRPPPIEYNYLGLREWLLGCVLGNSSLIHEDHPDVIARRAVQITDAVLKELHAPEHRNTDPAAKILLPRLPPTPSDSDAPPTTPHTPTSITKDRLKAISPPPTDPEPKVEGRYSFFNLPIDRED